MLILSPYIHAQKMAGQSLLDAQRKAIAKLLRLSENDVDLSGDVLILVLRPAVQTGRFSTDRPAQTRMCADFGSGKKMPVDDCPVFFHFHLGSDFMKRGDPVPMDESTVSAVLEQKNVFEEVD